jgi:phosphoenolpyruvate carboxykinase (diphosphate)
MPFQTESPDLISYINLKLAAMGQPTNQSTADPHFLEIAGPLLRNHHQKDLLLGKRLCSTDARIQSFLDSYLRSIAPEGAPRLPSNTFVLDRPGLARVMSLPPEGHTFSSPTLQSYRVAQGVLHNPKSDRRTTKGIFHVVEGGLPVPADKITVPMQAFAALLNAALHPPDDQMVLPFTTDQSAQARCWVSLLLRPLVCPATGKDPAKTTEIRFFAPASLVSNLDFVEGIFGNGGDPYLPENDSALDVEHWTGHTGCVIVAPHVLGIKKKDLGLPPLSEATELQKRDGMCWSEDDETYNEGGAFKITCRDHRGVMVTIIADNYYGYCKKEVKTQISFAANLFGLAEEEHAGGAIAFPSYVLGQDFYGDRTVLLKKARFDNAMRLLGDLVDNKPEGYAVDRRYPDIIYVPEDAAFSVREGFIHWESYGIKQKLNLRPKHDYVLPSGYKIRLEKQPAGTAWRLVGSVAHGTLCHKPCTVSGGGKSEISKSIANAILKGPVFVRDYQNDMDRVAEILKKDFSGIYRERTDNRTRRPILSPERSLGSVIKLLTPSADYTDEHNNWIHGLPQTIRQLVFTIKRYYRQEWGANWREHFTVNRINGFLGHELQYHNQALVGNYLRVGYDPDGSLRIYKLRPDFHPADKVQVEDDITASVVLPRESLRHLDPKYTYPSVKLVENCEQLLFQRPDDAIHPGADKQAEADIAGPGVFLSNFEPLNGEQARAIVDHTVEFDRFTDPTKRLLAEFVKRSDPGYVVSSALPRLVDGKPSKNPRYLQLRPDVAQHRETYLAEIGARLDREIPSGARVHFPVNAVLAGRRNNPPEPQIDLPPLAVYNPIHYQELPELFMDFICSLTGKSPSTTGFGSEGALTKGPFNALWPVVDLNNALVSYILTQHAGFTSAAGHVGPHYRVDHDISMLVPEIWCRMRVDERDPQFLIANGYLAKLDDFDYQGRTVLASRLGYRITARFADTFLGRIFETPDKIFPDELLCPEKQDVDAFVSGIDSIVAAQTRVALNYFEDGSVDAACPPLRALLHIMAHGHFEGRKATDSALRAMFTRESLIASEWYRERLRVKQERDTALWQRHSVALQMFRANGLPAGAVDLDFRAAVVRDQLKRVTSPAYLDELMGTLGADPFCRQIQSA